MDPRLKTLIDEINQQRLSDPSDAGIARRWCQLALELGQFDKVIRCANQFYLRATDPLVRLGWARLRAMTAFRGLSLEDALPAYALCLDHLCDLGDAGQLPQHQPAHATTIANQHSFVSGEAEQLLWKTCAALAAAGFPAFPYAGTLLGLERESRLLPFDKDIDLGIWLDHFEDCARWLESQGWQPIAQMLPFSGFKAFIDPGTQLTLDLVGLRRLSPDRGVLGGFFLEGRSSEYQSPRLFPWFGIEHHLSPEGLCWRIVQADEVLKSLYGDWRTPNPWWDGMVSDLCITENTLLWRCFAYDRLVARWADGQPERAWAYAHQILLKDAEDMRVVRAKNCLTQVLQQINPKALHWPPLSTRSVLESSF